MATVPRSSRAHKPRKPQPRSIALVLAPFEGTPGVVRIKVGALETEYLVQPIPADFGRAFTLTKVGSEEGEVYAVNLDGPKSQCGCKGFCRYGMAAGGGTGCKHIAALQALVNVGKL